MDLNGEAVGVWLVLEQVKGIIVRVTAAKPKQCEQWGINYTLDAQMVLPVPRSQTHSAHTEIQSFEIKCLTRIQINVCTFDVVIIAGSFRPHSTKVQGTGTGTFLRKEKKNLKRNDLWPMLNINWYDSRAEQHVAACLSKKS